MIELVLVAPSEDVCRTWAAAGGSLVLPWHVVFWLGRADKDNSVAPVRSLIGWTELLSMGASNCCVVSDTLVVRARPAVLQASHWL